MTTRDAEEDLAGEYRRHVRPYAIIPSELIRDRTLSADARWLQVVLLDRPPGWRPNARDLAGRAGMSRARVLRARRELIAAGWLLEDRERDDRGRIRTITHVLDRPLEGAADERAERLERLASAYRQQEGEQLELDVDVQTDEDLDALEEPADDTVDNPPDRDTPVGPRSDLEEHRERAGHTGVPLTGSGEEDPLVTTDRQVSRAPARDRLDDDLTEASEAAGAPRSAAAIREAFPWLHNRPSPSPISSSSSHGADSAPPGSPSGSAPAPPAARSHAEDRSTATLQSNTAA